MQECCYLKIQTNNLTWCFHCTVRYKDLLEDAYADLSDRLKSMGDVCAIIYCLERSMCDDLSGHLSQRGISCAGNNLCIVYAFELSGPRIYAYM
jgi:hypothetical protein